MKTTATIIIGLISIMSSHGQLTGEARLLKEKRDAKLAEINRVYLEQLSKMLTKANASGDTENAAAIQQEIAAATPQKTYTQKQLIGSWIREQSAGGKYDGDIFKITTEIRGSLNGKENFTITPVSTGFLLKAEKWTDTVKFINENTLKGGNGNHSYILTRQ